MFDSLEIEKKNKTKKKYFREKYALRATSISYPIPFPVSKFHRLRDVNQADLPSIKVHSMYSTK